MANTLKFGNGQWATKVGSTLAYNDEGGNFKPLPFNFTRSTSATRVNKDGLIEVVTNNKPRIDFLNDSNGALLLEPSRTNLITYSEDFNNAVWNFKTNVNLQGGMLSPKGDLTAYKITATTTDSSFFGGFLNQNTDKYKSIWARTVSGSGKVNLLNVRTEGSTDGLFNISEEWTRFEVLHNGADIFYGVDFRNSLSTLNEIIIWGAQLEVGSYATSYIPTQGSAVTRVLEISEIYNLDDYVSSETSWTATGEFIKGQDKDNSLYIFFAYHLASSNLFRIRDFANYVSFYLFTPIQSNINYSSSLGDTIKWAIRAKSDGSYSVYVDGVSIAETNGTFQKLDKYSINGSAKNKIKDLRVYNTALTDAELSSLTTI